MEYVHIKSLDKFHPGYKDRNLQWAKIYFKMVQGNPDCDMIENEIDWARLIKFILLELEAQAPIPLDDKYLARKGFDLKKRPISLTLQMLHNFIQLIHSKSETCSIDKSKSREEKEEDKDKELYVDFEKSTLQKWNVFCEENPSLTKLRVITPKRRFALKKRFGEKLFRDFDALLTSIKKQPFLLGGGGQGWVVSFDWLISNDTNYIKTLEEKYRKKDFEKGDDTRKKLNLEG